MDRTKDAINFANPQSTSSSSPPTNSVTSSLDGDSIQVSETSTVVIKNAPPSIHKSDSVGSMSWNLTLTEPYIPTTDASRFVTNQPNIKTNQQNVKQPNREMSEISLSSSNYHLVFDAQDTSSYQKRNLSNINIENYDSDSSTGNSKYTLKISSTFPNNFSSSSTPKGNNSGKWYFKYGNYNNQPQYNDSPKDNMNGLIKSSQIKASLQSNLEEHFQNGNKKSNHSTSSYKSFKTYLFNSVGGVTWGWNYFPEGNTRLRYHIHEILMGFMISLTIVPEMVAFSFIANVHPSLGLQGGYLLSIIATAFGGAPSVIHGPTGALSSVVGPYIKEICTTNDLGMEVCTPSGLENVFLATFFAGIILLFFSLLHLSSLAHLIPTSVIIGYCNGLAIIIGVSQFHPFSNPRTHEWVSGATLIWMLVHVFISMGIMLFWPKIPKIGTIIPPPLVAILVSIFIEKVVIEIFYSNLTAPFSTQTVGDTAHFSINTAYPIPFFFRSEYSFTNIQWDSNLLTLTCLISSCALMESLMVTYVIHSLRDIPVNGNQELFGLSVGLILCSFFGTLPGSSMLALTVMNFKAKGSGKESALFTGIFTLLILLAGSSLLNIIPISCLSGIMLIVVFHTFKWSSVPIMLFSLLPKRVRKLHPIMKRKITRWDAIIILIVSIACYVLNVVIAVLIGITLSAFVFAWEMRKQFNVINKLDEKDGIKYYEIEGPLFFGSKEKLETLFTPHNDPQTITILLKGRTTFFDYSALDALINIKRKYQRLGKRVIIKGLDFNTIKMIAKAEKLIEYVDYQMIELELPSVPKLYSPFTYPNFLLSTEETNITTNTEDPKIHIQN